VVGLEKPSPHYERLSKENCDELVVVLLSFDEMEGKSVFLRTCLSPVNDQGRSFHEFWFDIYVVYDDGRSPASIQNGQFTKLLIPEGLRPHVVSFVAESTRRLVDEVNPGEIYCVVKSAAMPNKAMRKHLILTKELENMGYFVSEKGLDSANRECCFLRRRQI